MSNNRCAACSDTGVMLIFNATNGRLEYWCQRCWDSYSAASLK